MRSRPPRHRRTGGPDGPAILLSRLARSGPVSRSPDVVGGWVPSPPLPADPVPPARVERRALARLRLSWADGLALRWAVARPAVLGLGAALLVAVLVAVLIVWRAQPSAVAAPVVHRSPRPTADAATEPGGAAAGAAGAEAVGAGAVGAGRSGAQATGSQAPGSMVHVVGAVRHPGLVQLAAGARVADAVRAAGGPTKSALLSSVNLARRLVDGEQLVVQRRGAPGIVAAPGAAGGSGGSSTGSESGSSSTAAGGSPAPPVDLNAATVADLDALPGIGPVLAQRILEWRTAHGRFSTVEELGEVSGIGEATLARLRPAVRV